MYLHLPTHAYYIVFVWENLALLSINSIDN